MLFTYGDGNVKLGKSDQNSKYLSCGLSLLPANYSGRNICPSHSAGCKKFCINFAGLGKLPSTQKARLNKTNRFFDDRKGFIEELFKELHSFNKKCKFAKRKACCRLNVFSDLSWDKMYPEIFNTFKDVQFYDYTKVKKKFEDWLSGKLPANYHLTFSRSENNHKECLSYLRSGGNVAMVFKNSLPTEYLGFKCVNGDMSDLRFLDKSPRIVALKAKGGARKDITGFVLDGDIKC